MDLVDLPDDWSAQRDTLRRIATHVVARAQQLATGHFALMPLPGGFGTPQFGADRRRVRVAGGSLLVENARGDRDGGEAAVTDVHAIAGSTIATLCSACGFAPDPDFWVGGDTPPLGDPEATIELHPSAASALGSWYSLGQTAMDATLEATPDPRASIVRLWPEHFDLGVDLGVGSSASSTRVNLGAAAGDGFHDAPYLYVGPWGDERPGGAGFWNAPFGAVLGYDDVRRSADPASTAREFLAEGVSRLAR